jgi:hypothetical protein
MSLLSGELWESQAQNDPRNNGLVRMPEGKRVSYDELLSGADPAIATLINREVFEERIDALQAWTSCSSASSTRSRTSSS